MKRYAFASTLVIVAGVALVFAVAMFARTWRPDPVAGVPPDHYTRRQRGPSLEDAVQAIGDTPENAFELVR